MPKAQPIKTGQVEETTIRRSVVEESDSRGWWTELKKWQDAEERPDFWDFLESLTDADWQKVTMRVWRFDGGAKNQLGAYIGDFGGPMNPLIFREQVGGGKFRIYVRWGSTIVYNETVENAGPEKVYNPQPGAGGAAPAPTMDTNGQLVQIMQQMVDRLERKFESSPLKDAAAADALGIQRIGFENALNIVKATVEERARVPAATGDPSQKQMVDLIMPVVIGMLTKALEPRNTLAETLEAMKMLRQLNQVSGSAPGADNFAVEAVRQIPAIMTGLGNVMDNYRRAAEANAQAAGARGGHTITMPSAPGGPANAAAPQPGGLPPGSATAPPPATADQVYQYLAGTLVSILNDASKKTEEAAEQALVFLETGAPVMVDQLKGMHAAGGIEGVMKQLASMPILSEIPKHPRGRAFVEHFLKEASEEPAAQS